MEDASHRNLFFTAKRKLRASASILQPSKYVSK